MSGPMNLVMPVAGDTTDTWGTVLNALLGLVENHDHTNGKGSQVPSAAVNVNADLSFGAFALTLAKAITFTEQAPSALTSYSSALFASSADHNLYWRNSSGTNVQITAGAQLNLSAVGGIGGDYAAVSALADFTDATHTYGLHQQIGAGVRQYGKLATGDVSLFEFKANPTAGVPVSAVTLKSPAALAAPYAVTWLAALPGATSMLQISTTGVLTASNTIPTPTAPDYKWSATRDIPVPLQPVAKFVTNTAYDGDGISIDSTGINWDVRTMVLSGIRVGDRIVGAVTSSAFTGTMQLRIDKVSNGGVSSTGCTIALVTGGTKTGTFSSPYTLLANESVYIDISGTANGAILSQLTLQVDRP